MGLSVSDLRRRLHHVVYDGVFAATEKGDCGGGLDLCSHLEEILGCD